MRNSLFLINHAVERFIVALNQEKKKMKIKIGLL